MRRLILMLTISALAMLSLAAPAQAASFKSCGPVKAKIGNKNYVLAIKVQVRGMSCAAANEFWKAYATGEQGSATVEDIRKNCKPGSKAAQKAAAKKGRTADVCRSSDGKMITKAWVLGG